MIPLLFGNLVNVWRLRYIWIGNRCHITVDYAESCSLSGENLAPWIADIVRNA